MFADALSKTRSTGAASVGDVSLLAKILREDVYGLNDDIAGVGSVLHVAVARGHAGLVSAILRGELGGVELAEDALKLRPRLLVVKVSGAYAQSVFVDVWDGEADRLRALFSSGTQRGDHSLRADVDAGDAAHDVDVDRPQERRWGV